MIASHAALDRFFAPASVALVGASPDKAKIRGRLLEILRHNGYSGRIHPVNPSYREIDGLACHPSVAAIGAPIDVAVLAIPAERVIDALGDCATSGVRHAVIITSGFAEQGGARNDLQVAIAALARRSGMRVCGPNAEGFHNEIARVSATFSPAVDARPAGAPEPAGVRRVGVVAQSGGIGFALYNRGRAIGVNFSYVVSTGNEADLTASDFFRYMVEDEATDCVLLFLEGVRDGPGFVAAAAEAARRDKPVIVVKIGRTAVGERAAISHTASLTGWNAAYDAVFARYGIIAAGDPDEAVAMAAALTTCPTPHGSRVAVLTASGGAGGWAADVLAERGLDLPELSPALQGALQAVMPDYGSARNPVDVTAQAVQTGGLVRAMELLSQSDEIDMVAAVVSLANDRRVLIEPAVLKSLLAAVSKPILFHSYTLPSAVARARFAEAGAVVHAGLAEFVAATRALAARARFAAPRELARPAAPSAAILGKLADVAEGCCEYQAKDLLAALGVALPARQLAADVGDLAPAATAVGYPLALKIQSPDIAHKTEAGGVRLGIVDAAALHAAYDAMLAEVRQRHPGARLHGVLLEPMASPGIEVIVGVIRDAVFGPLVMVGAGGVAAELRKDVAYRLAPVDAAEARAMLGELAIAPLLAGWRGAPTADVDALVRLIVLVADFAAGCDAVQEIELNPVRVHPAGEGCIVLDALLRMRRADGAAEDRHGQH